MFSTAQNDYLKSLIPAMRRQGYRYYLAYSDNDRDNNYNPDLYVIFAKDKIMANSCIVTVSRLALCDTVSSRVTLVIITRLIGSLRPL